MLVMYCEMVASYAVSTVMAHQDFEKCLSVTAARIESRPHYEIWEYC